MRTGLDNGFSYLDIRAKRVEEIKKEVMKKICLFGSDGRYYIRTTVGRKPVFEGNADRGDSGCRCGL